ncbi:hypothetical protein [Archangium sp.]|jgi:hypothetical protein|uniref:hypothetical protein n=1 Tax=Archangium sp. TaxID=1872627 RepID=UPI002EDA341E
MKVAGRDEAAPARQAPDKGRFQEVLKKSGPEAKSGPETVKAPVRGGQLARPPVGTARPPTGTVATTAQARTPQRGAFASSEHLGQVRQGMTVESHRLRDVRGQAHQTDQERVRQRVTDLIFRELAREPRPEPVSPHSATPRGLEPSASPPPVEALSAAGEVRTGGPGGASAAALDTPNPEVRAQAALELIEKIEVFVKSQRPALAMRLGGALDATVEVERTGAREVSLRIQGRRGPLPQEDLARIRDALAERGLKLSAFLTS